MLLRPVVEPLTSAVESSSPPKDEDVLFAKSRSSSFSQSSQSSQSSFAYRKFHHYKEPTVLDRPYIVSSIETALHKQDSEQLAQLVRQYGLPSSLRSQAWPLLLSRHPYVQEALELRETTPIVTDDELPLKRLKGDLRRFRRHRGPALREHDIFHAIHSFLQRWSSRIPYDSAMIWIADFLVSGDIGANINDNNYTGNSSSTSSMSSNSSSEKTSRSTSGSSYRSEDSPDSDFDMLASSPLSSAQSDSEDTHSFAFSGVSSTVLPEVFQNVMLVITHASPEYSDFVTMVRQYLPELSLHFANELVLSGSSGGDDWLIWWLRWLGIRAFPSCMLARLWDEYFSMSSQADLSLMREHFFACVLLMKENRGRLLELDQSECRQYLTHIPVSRDVEALINDARKLSLDHCHPSAVS